ncbi:SDR family NAD(P)-dependent oxidoreductase [Pelomonas sp. APW6]|uniref:SDR family NAD(P)-dependent oxidoreductase n=1 Tax=Roseateles subflavus TaxID=3053353 RepID=A0ABT7LD69_9BURK|nr:SDR family NAD(P)-dependent oxidoreductase [Pelomonas sp. APW6]MDL5030816.1 SDR family NAD(P)-dependent oxidoreductase [Pelomonas sp. APW6]
MAQTLHSLPEGYQALVIGARGAIGAALLDQLQADPRCATALGLHRQSDPALDLLDEAGVAAAAQQLAEQGPFQLIINAAGRLHGPGLMPEKKLGDLRLASLQAIFAANTFGPALLLHHFTPLLDRHCGRLAMLSAKVGSIGDNRLGGWYGYRASKAALNMLIRTAAIELRRSHPGALVAALHPGTVASALSAPFRGGELGRPPATAAAELLSVLDGLQSPDSGGFFSYTGEALPW